MKTSRIRSKLNRCFPFILLLTLQLSLAQVAPGTLVKKVDYDQLKLEQKDLQLKRNLEPLLERPDVKGLRPIEKVYVAQLNALAKKMDNKLLEKKRLQEKIMELKIELGSVTDTLKKTNDVQKRKKLKTRQSQLEKELKHLEKRLENCNRESEMMMVELQNAVQKRQQHIQLMSNLMKAMHDSAMNIVRNIK